MDKIFGDIPKCDVLRLFPHSRNPALTRRRRSSGDWTKDKITEAEKERYDEYYEKWINGEAM